MLSIFYLKVEFIVGSVVQIMFVFFLNVVFIFKERQSFLIYNTGQKSWKPWWIDMPSLKI